MNFLFRNLNSLVFGGQSTSSSTLVEIPSGQLYSLSLNSARTLIFRDAAASIRRTATLHNFQLVVTRVYDEDEVDDDDDDEKELNEDDEKTFLLDAQLRFNRVRTKGGSHSFFWADPQDFSGAKGWEFVIDEGVQELTMSLFEDTAYTCMFERAMGADHGKFSDQQLAEFVERIKRDAREKVVGRAAAKTPVRPAGSSVAGSSLHTPQSTSKRSVPTTPTPAAQSPSTPQFRNGKSPARTLASIPKGEELLSVPVQLYLYDLRVQQFMLVNDQAIAEITEIGEWKFQLVVKSGDHVYLCQPIEEGMSPTFNAEHHTFIFNYLDETTGVPIYTWSLKFATVANEGEFKEMVTECVYEVKNKELFRKMKKDEQVYLMQLYDDDPMEIDEREELQGDEGEDEEWEEEETAPAKLHSSRDDDDDEASDDESGQRSYKEATTGSKNSQLAVGYRHDRSFVVRGDKIGVFKHTADDGLEFATAINNVRTLDGQMFSPRKVMLHQQDAAMVMMKPGDENKLYKMDLEAGKVVEEWKVDDERKVEDFVPDQKYSQLTTNQTLVGIGHNSIFRIDPRLQGNKLVESESNQYATKNAFTCAATTGKGELAVASAKGEIRLYNKLNMRAKTHLPGTGDAIIGIDTTENGKWIIATCRTHLLLINSEMAGGTLGFQKSMGAHKPQLKRLQLKPEHVTWLGGAVQFTPARFSTGESEELAIITSSGPNVIRWNFRRVKAGHLYDYTIKQYKDTVVADNFKYGEDRAMIVALPSEVEMITKKTLSTPAKLLKSRLSIVNSPY
ncbi:VID27 cytoplasmic protein-domain-containing protein [Fimicolochytrium jonesii]|uniref:VID27 cytoplasmic protein-domain-containing protein n=1 Tax=Fimicolochytrium jonesii TaxID=1396493 RepID=UPI0022FEA865|nr:VID27 cytoplasmic protein-domain-containing protein [Fimicolochytrium jonesii]KAI8821064.1 VID27 cytoplasmic protein-domain-containing protein [Fimicolochytrium jonesii]